MKLTIKKKEYENGHRIKLSFAGEITVNIVNKLKSRISELIEKYGDLEFDFSEVSRIDSAGFQLLIFFRRETESSGKKILLTNPSIEVLEMFNLYGENI